LPLLDLNTRANPCSKTWQEILLKTLWLSDRTMMLVLAVGVTSS
jgi:hypothetical protein